MAKSCAFLDTSVFITALLSKKGGSFYILTVMNDTVSFKTNEYVLEEIKDVLRNKFPHRSDLRTDLFLLLGIANVIIVPNQSRYFVSQLAKHISEKDAPILASAIKESDYLLTLDNEFFYPSIIALAKRNNLTIFKPKGLIELLRE